MNIDKKQLLEDYLDGRSSGNYNVFFNKAKEIADFILVRKYYSLTIDPEEHADVLQDCMVSLWEKILANKVDPDKGDLMSFIWQNSTFKILDYLKKQKRRNDIVQIVTYSETLTESSYVKKTSDYDYNESMYD